VRRWHEQDRTRFLGIGGTQGARGARGSIGRNEIAGLLFLDPHKKVAGG
jgi:hypothetical protein